jgi:iron complex outermembrane recepter protein
MTPSVHLDNTRSRSALRIILGFALSAAACFAAPVKLDIPAQSAASSLPAFSKQSGVKVMFVNDELKDIRTNAVSGEHEPADGLTLLLRDTALTFNEREPGWFVVKNSKLFAEKPGSIEGQVRDESGKPVANARISLAGSDQFILTDRRGRFTLEDVPAGAQAVSIFAEGMQKTRVTDVVVRGGHRHTLSAITIPATVAGITQLEDYVVSAKKNDGVVELTPYEVSGDRSIPFADSNIDIPRTINDVQPYYIFDSKTLNQSGASNTEEFLKNRLSMNSVRSTLGQTAGGAFGGSNSTINLRGIGADKTLILVNGRRLAGTQIQTGTSQPNVNGVPLSAIDRIEVLPTSASGIYGASALGGVINIVLKKDFAGGELRASYANTWDSDSPSRKVALSWGQSFNSGRTRVFFNAEYSDSKPIYLQDRVELLERGLGRILQFPQYYTMLQYYVGTPNPVQGATANVASVSGAQLTLRSTGASLNSNIATFPAAYSTSSNPSTIIGGRWNLELPWTGQGPRGRYIPMGAFPKADSYMLTAVQEISPKLEVFFDGTYRRTKTYAESTSDLGTSGFNSFNVSQSNPNNPFNQEVRVSFPAGWISPWNSYSHGSEFSAGVNAKLPYDWVMEMDYTMSDGAFSFNRMTYDSSRLQGAIDDGSFNPFTDHTADDIASAASFFGRNTYEGDSFVRTIGLRSAGHVPAIGVFASPFVATGIEQRISGYGDNHYVIYQPNNGARLYDHVTTAKKQRVQSAYVEAHVPLITSEQRVPFVHELELQATGRMERFTVQTGSSGFFDFAGSLPSWLSPTLNGQPVHSKARFESIDPTVGLKYRPIQQLVVRSSRGTAFLPPTYSQLIRNPIPNANPQTLIDPKLNVSYGMRTISGGNPLLTPENTESWNLGVIWEPTVPLLHGTRFNIEWYRITQLDKIGSLSASDTLANEALFPDRITRDPSTGRVTLIDLSAINLTRYETEGFDFSAAYRKQSDLGEFTVTLLGTVIRSERRQFTLNGPEREYAGFPISGGPLKIRGNASLDWYRGGWNASWITRYFGPSNVDGSKGSPNGEYPNIVAMQGSTVSSQLYHDAFISYSFPIARDSIAGRRILNSFTNGLTVHLSVANLFNAIPPLDLHGILYTSPYGGIRLREYTVGLRKRF